MKAKFKSFAEFYPFYLSEHKTSGCRRFHFAGNLLSLLLIFTAIINLRWGMFIVAIVVGYGFAWIGHFFFEKNKPATFKYPLYSFIGDWVMFGEILKGAGYRVLGSGKRKN